MPNVPMLTFAETRAAVKAAIRSKVAMMIWGPPGIGKTALVTGLQEDPDVGLPVHTLVASNCDATDIAGLPVVVDNELRRIPMAVIRACADAPGILFMDEATTTPPAVRGPTLRLWLERVAGDLPLHPGSAVIGAANDPEHCPGAFDLDAATANRFIQIEMAPSVDEVREHARDIWGTRPGEPKSMREEALDWAATLGVEGRMLEMTPPPGSVQQGAPWGSPRAWERGLRAYCEAHDLGLANKVARSMLEGSVGTVAASSYLGIKDLRKHLPSIDDIKADPVKARLPEKREHQVAALGLLTRLASQDSDCAWIYTQRLAPEIRLAATRGLMPMPDVRAPGSKWLKQGKQAKIACLTAARKELG